jgi:hypothetical protein
MYRPESISLRVLVFACLLGMFAGFANGQATPNPTSDTGYEAILDILVGSNEAAPGKGLPKSLSAVQRQLNENFTYSNYTLSNTLLSRLSSPGDVEYKSVSDRLGKEVGDYPTFVDWSLQLRPTSTAQANKLQMENFRFGARVPIVTDRTKGPDGQSPGATMYEPIGLTTRRVVLPIGKPSLIGTVSLPGTAGTLFLVLTIRPAAD